MFVHLVYLPANMQLSHPSGRNNIYQTRCIYLPICSFHTERKQGTVHNAGVFTCQYAAFTPALESIKLKERVYLPANMQLSHHPIRTYSGKLWCIYLPICSFHTLTANQYNSLWGVFTCQYAAFTPRLTTLIRRALVYLPANMQLSHQGKAYADEPVGCIYLPICSFHTGRLLKRHSFYGVFTCQYAAFTPSQRDYAYHIGVYLPANMQLSHLQALKYA